MHFKQLIRTVVERRKSLGLTQEMLAGLSDISLRTIKQFESGEGNPTLRTLSAIIDVLGLEMQVKVKEIGPRS